jgi:large subunit ribosomal protein L18
MNTKFDRQLKRKKRVRAKIIGTIERPRLSVFRSNRFVYAQLINDTEGKTLVAKSSQTNESKKTKSEKAFEVGKELAEAAKKKKIELCVFDRSSYRYHGIVKSVAEGAREGGLKF